MSRIPVHMIDISSISRRETMFQFCFHRRKNEKIIKKNINRVIYNVVMLSVLYWTFPICEALLCNHAIIRILTFLMCYIAIVHMLYQHYHILMGSGMFQFILSLINILCIRTIDDDSKFLVQEPTLNITPCPMVCTLSQNESCSRHTLIYF